MSAKIVFFGVVFSFSSFFPLQTTQAPQTKPHPQNHQKQQKNKQNPFPNNKTMQEAARSRQDERKKNFKKGLDSSESRRRRSEQNVAVRKNRREELALKRRNITLSSPDRSSSSSSSSSSFPSFEGGELTDELTQMVFSNNEEYVQKPHKKNWGAKIEPAGCRQKLYFSGLCLFLFSFFSLSFPFLSFFFFPFLSLFPFFFFPFSLSFLLSDPLSF